MWFVGKKSPGPWRGHVAPDNRNLISSFRFPLRVRLHGGLSTTHSLSSVQDWRAQKGNNYERTDAYEMHMAPKVTFCVTI